VSNSLYENIGVVEVEFWNDSGGFSLMSLLPVVPDNYNRKPETLYNTLPHQIEHKRIGLPISRRRTIPYREERKEI
jgi:hypothetical protein